MVKGRPRERRLPLEPELQYAHMSDRTMTRNEKFLAVIGLGVFAAIVLLALNAYVNPSMLIDFANLRLCS